MILLDPDLEAVSRTSLAMPRAGRLPSARALRSFLVQAQAAVRLAGAVTVLLTTDAAIRKLNKQFRGMNKATDVLSFPAYEMAEGVAGDLAVSVDTARRQAAEQGHALGVEIKVLVLHGLLHLAGYDHETDKGEMARRERVLRAKLKLPQGLIERAEIRKDKSKDCGGGMGVLSHPSSKERSKDGARGRLRKTRKAVAR